jgi:anti-sigma regulatory factor (Ser/Thr protein kinase)
LISEIFYPAATILLFAEVDRLVELSPLPKPITLFDPRRRRPREVLKQIGIHELTGDVCTTVPEREDVVYWKSIKGLDQSGDKLAVLEVVADRVNKEHANQLILNGVWRGVSEAVANSVEHAYKKPRADGFNGLAKTRWWAFTQLRDGVFTMAVCDLGCGYRATIEKTIPEQFIASITSTLKGYNHDALAIDIAMQFGRSGTRASERGKGSRDAMAVLEKHGAGDLMIMSNTGWMRYVYSASKQFERTHGGLGIDIKGTIVWWRLPLKE